MLSFASFDGTEISYCDEGSGPVVLLLHGAFVDTSLNWQLSGVADCLTDAGFRVIAADARGHGCSAKPHEATAYADGALVKDVIALIDHLGADQVALVGYSMGADTAMRAASTDGRVAALVAGGAGAGNPDEYDAAEVAQAIRNVPTDEPVSELSAGIAALAHSMGGDVDAYAALFEGEAMAPLPPPRYSDISCPTLVITGENDDMAIGGAEGLASEFPTAEAISIPGQDHLGAIFDPLFSEGLITFLRRQYMP